MKNDDTPQQDPLNGRRISDILATLADSFTTPTVTIGELRDALSGRIYGIFLLVLALPNIIPIPAPGLSAVLGTPLILLTFQLMLGWKTPWFPKFIVRQRIKTEYIRRLCEYVLPWLRKLERIILPRWMWLVKYPADRLIALLCVVLSLAIMMPIPFGNALPALAICCFAIAILQRDGLCVILGIVVGLLATSVIVASLSALLMALQKGLGL